MSTSSRPIEATIHQRRAAGASTLGILLGIAAVLTLAVLFVHLTDQVIDQETIHFDRTIALAVHAWTSPGLTAFMFVATEFGRIIAGILAALWLVVGLALAWRVRQTRRPDGSASPFGERLLAAVAPIIAILGATGLAFLVKELVGRQRPTIFPPLAHESGPSFPSGHTITALAFYGMCAWLLVQGAWRLPNPQRMLARMAIILAAVALMVLVGISRIYLGVHYPSDVLGSGLLGLAWLISLIVTLTIVESQLRRARAASIRAP